SAATSCPASPRRLSPRRGDRGCKQSHDRGTPRGRRPAAILIHTPGDGRAVVKEGQLSTHASGVDCASFPCQIGKEGLQPATVLVGDDFTRVAAVCLRGRADEPASAKLRTQQRLLNFGEHSDEALSRRVMSRQNLRDALLPVTPMLLEVSTNELVLAAESA